MHTQINLLRHIVRMSRLGIWVVIFFCLFLSVFIGKAEEGVANDPCSDNQNTIPSDPTALTLQEGTTTTFRHYLCGKLQKPLTVTFILTSTTVSTETLILTPTELYFSKIMTDPQRVTIYAVDNSKYSPPQVIIIRPQIETDDSKFKDVKMVSITVTINDKEARAHLPFAGGPQPTPTATPIPTPQWQRVGGKGQDSDVIALHQNNLFLGDRREKNVGGGIYRATVPLAGCPQTLVNFAGPSVPTKVLDLAFHTDSDPRGLAGSFSDKIFYSTDHGNSWRPTGSSTNPFVYAVSFTDNPSKSYAGADDGVYLSDNGGATWRRLGDSPTAVNTFYRNGSLLWIGTFQQGISTLAIDTNVFTNRTGNLTGKAREVWDITYSASATTNTYYLATSDGVYRGSGDGAWEKIGLQNLIVYSLAVTNEQIYAGLSSRGVWRRQLNLATDWIALTQGAEWKENFTVRDLLYDGTLCNSVFAATDDGVWIYR